MKYENEFYVTGAKVGKPAPRFDMEAVLPKGDMLERFGRVNLDDLLEQGKWVVLYFYPLDFTFVCPTEIQRFNELTKEFEDKNAVLIAASTDSVHSHLAWQESSLGRLHHIHASDNNHEVSEAYGEKSIVFGREQFIPKPLDPRLIYYVAPAVAKAAMDSGVAKNPIKDWDAYEAQLKKRLGLDNKLIRTITEKAERNPKRVVFAEADDYKTLKAAQTAYEEGVAFPILLGRKEKVLKMIKEHSMEFPEVEIIDPKADDELERRERYSKVFFEIRQRKGFTLYESLKIMRERNYFGSMMVQTGDADAMISGTTRNYRDVLRPALQVVGKQKDVGKVAGMYILITKKGPMFLADTTVNFDPTAEEIADMAHHIAKTVRKFKITPRIALLSYSNFGSSPGKDANKMAKAVKIIHEKYPTLSVDGELQANFALNQELLLDKFSFSELANKEVNTLIFPNLSSGNIAYKLLQEMMGAEAIGPVLVGLNKSIHVMQLGASVREIVNMVKVAVVDAQNK